MTAVYRVSATVAATLLFLQLSPAKAWAEERVEPVVDGQAAATIVLAEEPTRAAQLAAFELQHHLEQITGATLPIVREPANPQGLPILVGPGQAAAAAGAETKQFGAQEYLVRVAPEAVLLAGRDAEDRGAVVYDPADPMRFKTWPNLFSDQGTLHAVYEFLERLCGVRWYSPTELGTVCPRQATLSLRPTEIRRRPAFIYRDLGHAMLISEAYNRCVSLWPRDSQVHEEVDALGYPGLKQRFPNHWYHLHAKRGVNRLFLHRMRVGGQPYRANHSFYGYYNRFWEKNAGNPEVFVERRPEYFAQGYEGRPPQMCYTNPGFVDQVIQDARDYFDGKGTPHQAVAYGDFFALVPQDNSGYCKCAACQAQMNQAYADSPFFSNGYASDYVFGFANKVGRAIAASHPDKFLATLAYARYAYYPERVRLEPNIAVQLCLHVRNIHDTAVQENDLKFFNSWVTKEKDRPIYLWLYYCFPTERGHRLGGWHVWPGFFAHGIDRWFKRFAAHGVKGAFFNGGGQDVEMYVTCKLLDDPTQDVDALLDDYFAGYFGAAAEPMKRFYLLVEDVYSDPANYPPADPGKPIGHQTEKQAWCFLGTPERMAELRRYVEQARRLARTDIERQRIALFEREVWDYLQAGPVHTQPVERSMFVDSPATVTRLLGRPPEMLADDAAHDKPFLLETPHSVLCWREKTHRSGNKVHALTDGNLSESLFLGSGKHKRISLRCDLGPVPDEGRQLRRIDLCWTLADPARSRVNVSLAVHDAETGKWREVSGLLKVQRRETSLPRSHKLLSVRFPAGAVTGFDAVRLTDAAAEEGWNCTRFTEVDVVTEGGAAAGPQPGSSRPSASKHESSRSRPS